MLLPLSWLKEFVELDDVSASTLEQKLIECGFEVEETKNLGAEIENCVCGQITQITKHPDSDHLQICKLNCTEKFGTDIQIVTGAQNVFVGAVVPVALHGATLAGGIKIKSGKLRGQESHGMLCSGEELGIDENFFDGAGVDGILILPKNTPLGKDIKEVVGLNDIVFDVSITPNRPDTESIFGLAREVAAIFGKKVKHPPIFFNAQEADLPLDLQISNSTDCTKYIAQAVKDVRVEQSPVWLRQRLAKCGINAINNIVDITNYVLLELGQPMHAFDYAQIAGNKIVVRSAQDGEKITTLDEKTSVLTPKNLVIANQQEPMALAGVMGGAQSGVTATTTTIVFESAKFMRESVRKTSRALGIASESSHRFEKDVDEFTTSVALNRALNLVEMLKAGTVTTVQKSFQKGAPKNQPIRAQMSKINQILGIDVPQNTALDILTRLGFEIQQINADTFTATAPEFRKDVQGVADLAEEIIRLYGYCHIVPRLLTRTSITNGGLNSAQKIAQKTLQTLTAQGFNEIITYSLTNKKDLDILKLPTEAPERNFIALQNPLSEDLGILKTTLAFSTLNIITKNFKKGIESGRVFEFANVYFPKELPLASLPTEQKTICLGAWGAAENFFTLKGAIQNIADVFGVALKFEKAQKAFLHPNRTAQILCNGAVVGYIGQIGYDIAQNMSVTNQVFLAEINYAELCKHFNTTITYRAISRHPSIKRDLALVVDKSVTSGAVEDLIRQTAKRIESIKLFDVYEGAQLPDGKKSLAFNLQFAAAEEPLSHEEVDAQIKKILNRLSFALGATLRA